MQAVDILLRSISLYVLVFVLVRFIGKKHPAKMTPFNFVTYVVIAAITALTALGVIRNFVFGIIALAVWVLLPIGLDYLSLRSKAVHDLINGKETVIIKQGKVMEENLKQVRLSGEELLRDLRQKDVFNVADVEFAVLETTGDLNVLLKSAKKPITPYALEWKVAPQLEPQTVILDGNILNESLTNLGLNQRWLNTQLESTGVSLDNIFLGQVNSSGELYVDLFDDSISLPQPQIKEMLYAQLENVQAELTKYSLEVEDKGAKKMYAGNAEKLQGLLDKLRPYLLR